MGVSLQEPPPLQGDQIQTGQTGEGGQAGSGNKGGEKSIKRRKRTLLLNMPITVRLGLGFLIPALLAAIALGSVGVRSQQLLSHESKYYYLLIDSYTTLGTENDTLQLIHSNLLGYLNDASKPQPSFSTLTEDQALVNLLTSRFDATLQGYFTQDLLSHSGNLSALFADAGHSDQVSLQEQDAELLASSWQTFRTQQQGVFSLLNAGKVFQATIAEIGQVEPAYADLMSSLLRQLQLTGALTPSIHDALAVEEDRLLFDALFAALSILLGIGVVGWLVFSTVARRLQKARRVMKVIEGGQIEVRLPVVGRDEIASVCSTVNGMLDTIVGLLEETREQRDELANAEELKRLHEQLQSKHQALNEANARLAALATTDPLTGLANHRTVMGRIEEELSRSCRTNETCALLFIDLDHFKRVNDTWGHLAGDAVLIEAGQRLTSAVRFEDFVGRYGGEEFAVLLIDADLESARAVGERLCAALAASPYTWQPDDDQAAVSIQMSGSIGVAIFQEHAQTCAALIEAADTAMYQAKHGGRNRVCCTGDALSLAQEVLTDERLVEDKAALQALLATIHAFDQDTGSHAVRMMQLAEATGTMLGCSEEEQQLLRLAALMHDIGKIGIPQEILHKPGPLTDEEWEIMRRHPGIGRQILAQAGGQCALLSHIVVAHHERWDGKGYPYGLAHEAIPLSARILSVVDSYDAMTSDRPYRAAMSQQVAIEELQCCAGAQFDPQVVTAFLLAFEQQGQEIPLIGKEGVPIRDEIELECSLEAP